MASTNESHAKTERKRERKTKCTTSYSAILTRSKSIEKHNLSLQEIDKYDQAKNNICTEKCQQSTSFTNQSEKFSYAGILKPNQYDNGGFDNKNGLTTGEQRHFYSASCATPKGHYHQLQCSRKNHNYNAETNDTTKVEELFAEKIRKSHPSMANLLRLCAEYLKFENNSLTQDIVKNALQDMSVKVEEEYKLYNNNFKTDWKIMLEKKYNLESYIKELKNALQPLKTNDFQVYCSVLDNYENYLTISDKLENYLARATGFFDCQLYLKDLEQMHETCENLQTVENLQNSFLLLHKLLCYVNNFNTKMTNCIPNYDISSIGKQLQTIEKKLIKENVNRILNESEAFLNQFRKMKSLDKEAFTKESLDSILTIIEQHIALINGIKNSILNLDEFCKQTCIFKSNDLTKELQLQKDKFSTLINEINNKEAVEFCKKAKNLIEEASKENNSYSLKVNIENALKFEDKLHDTSELKKEVNSLKSKLEKISVELIEKEKKIKELKKAEQMVNEMNETREQIETTTDIKQLEELLKKDKSITGKFWKAWNYVSKNVFGRENPEYEKQVQLYKTSAERHQKIINEKVKIRQDMLNNFEEDIKLENDGKNAVEKNNLSDLKCCLTKIQNRIIHYTRFDLKEFKDALSKEISNQVNKLQEISAKLSEKIIYLSEKKNLEEKINKQEELCKQAEIFWGNLSELDKLLDIINEYNYNIITDFKISNQELNAEVEKLINALFEASENLERKRVVIGAKEKLDEIDGKIIELQKSVHHIQHEDNESYIKNVKQYLINVDGLLKTIKQIDTYNNDRLNKEADKKKETLNKSRVSLEQIELQYEIMFEQEDEKDDIYEDNLDQLQLTPNLTFLSEIGLSLIKILHQLDKNVPDLNMINLKAELDDKKSVLIEYKCNEKEEKEYKERCLVICNKIIEKMPREIKQSNIVEEIKLESLKATHYYTEIVSASHIEKTKASIMENRILKIMSNLDKLDVGHDKDTLRETRKDVLNLCNQSLSIIKSKLQQ